MLWQHDSISAGLVLTHLTEDKHCGISQTQCIPNLDINQRDVNFFQCAGLITRTAPCTQRPAIHLIHYFPLDQQISDCSISSRGRWGWAHRHHAIGTEPLPQVIIPIVYNRFEL
jgi:hypothetical protein